MLGLIGIRKNVDINIRERLAIALSKQSKAVKELNKLYEEVVIIWQKWQKLQTFYQYQQ